MWALEYCLQIILGLEAITQSYSKVILTTDILILPSAYWVFLII